MTGVALSGDGRMLAATTSEGLTLWDPATRRPLGPTLRMNSFDTGLEEPVVSACGLPRAGSRVQHPNGGPASPNRRELSGWPAGSPGA
jgi:hypothetical protein